MPRPRFVFSIAIISCALFEICVYSGNAAVIEHVPDMRYPSALVEHEAVVVLGIHCEGRAVLRVGDILRLVEVLTGRARTDSARHRVELVHHSGRDPRAGNQNHQDYNRDDQDVLDCRLPLQAAGTPRRYPPPKGISAAFMRGSPRIGLADAVEDRYGLTS